MLRLFPRLIIPPRLAAGSITALFLSLAACDSGGTSTAVPTQIQVTPGSVTLVGSGTQQQFAARVLDQSGNEITGVTVSWSSSAPAVVTVSTSGLATSQSEGTAQIRASYSGVTGFSSVSVLPQNGDCTVTVSLAVGQSLVQDAVGASGCDLFLPSGSSGDRYRVGLVWPESDENETTVADATIAVTGVGVTGGLPASLFTTAADSRDPLPESLIRGLSEDVLRAEANARAHVRLREQERAMLPRLAEALRSVDRPTGLGMAAEGAPLLAPSATRWVYDPAVGGPTNDPCQAGTPRVAELVAENDLMAVYQDSIQATTSPVSVPAVQEMLDYYRDYGKSVIDSYFGGAPDINGDGRLRALIAPVVETKNAVAFVWSGDMFPKSSCPQSNEMDLIYLAVGLVNQLADPQPTWQTLGTIVHEAKHVSSLWNGVKGAVEGGSARGLHPSWIEEGTAEIAGEMSSRLAWELAGGPARGTRVDEQDFRDSPGTFNADNYNVVLRLARTIQYMAGRPNGLMNLSSQQSQPYGTIYGSGWHFHRFLGDMYGNATTPGGDAGFFSTQNAETSTPGVPGIEALTGRSFALLFLEYAEAILGHSVGLGSRPVDFRTYDFLATEMICSSDDQSPFNSLGRYPWALTTTGTGGTCTIPEIAEEFKSFATATYDGKLGASGIQVLDLVSNGSGDGADITVGLSTAVPAKWVVVRVN